VDPVIESLLLRSAVLFLLTGSLAGLVVGALLLWWPQRLRAVSGILNRWVSTRRVNRILDQLVLFDRRVYRYSRVSAVTLILASGYILYYFTVRLDRSSAIIGLSRRFALPSSLVGGLLDALVLCVLLGALFALFVSLFLLRRPSLLKDFEQSANQWISLRRALRPLELPREGVDEYVFKFGPQAGILLVLGSLYTLALLTIWLAH